MRFHLPPQGWRTRSAGARALGALGVAGAALLALALSRAADRPGEGYPHGRFRGECSQCHDAGAWLPARPGKDFDHGRFAFPLTGAHAAAACRSCHRTLDFTAQETGCVSCHQDVHRGELGVDCARCHGARSFIDRGGMVRAHQLTRFPLAGRHAGLDCERCHPPAPTGHMRFVGTEAACEACHLAEYRAAKSPDHVAGGFPLECASCHRQVRWSPAAFDHGGTSFPLTGAHRATPCAGCHGDGVYAGRSAECVSCHRAAYDGTADPPHAAAGFGIACQSCHHTASWRGATFDHAGTAFPLTGAHVGTACASCHGDGVYDGKDTQCVSCHRADYDAADPAHAAAGFPTTCQSCHSTATWSGATFDHDGTNFPIYSGRHAGLWSACSTCHQVPGSYAQFTCFSCHPHSDPTQTASNHGGVAGYQYDSRACYSCHPRGTKS